MTTIPDGQTSIEVDILAACLVEALKIGREGVTIFMDVYSGGLAYQLTTGEDGCMSSGSIGPDGDAYDPAGWWVDGERNVDAYNAAYAVLSDLERSGFTVRYHG